MDRNVACPSGCLHSAPLIHADAARAERLIADVLQPQRLTVEHVRSLDDAVPKPSESRARQTNVNQRQPRTTQCRKSLRLTTRRGEGT